MGQFINVSTHFFLYFQPVVCSLAVRSDIVKASILLGLIRMKVALVHDWINGMRGGERCLDAFLRLYPDADIFTLFYVPGKTNARIDARVKTVSVLNRLPFARRFYRLYLPLIFWAARRFDFSGYDLVISLSHAAVKNVRVPRGTPHVIYCFTPMRYIWDQARAYFGALTPLFWPLILILRRWDVRESNNPTAFVAISDFIRARIRCFYKRRAAVIFPPVDTSWIRPDSSGQKGEAFLWAGALVPYKRPDLVIEAFNQIGEPLWVVGDGPELERLKAGAKGNITFFGRVSDAELADRYRRCRALVFPGVEDFGMIPIECLAAGRPVIGLEKGGVGETINAVKHWNYGANYHGIAIECSSGVFIKANPGHELEELIKSLRFFIAFEDRFERQQLVEHARAFSPERFAEQWNNFLAQIGIAHVASRSDVKREASAI